MTEPADRSALDLLAEIQDYVSPKPFSVDGIARGLGKKDRDSVARQIAWLKDGGYIEQLGDGGPMRLTQKGKSNRLPAATEDDDGFRIEFAESRKSEAEANDAAQVASPVCDKDC